MAKFKTDDVVIIKETGTIGTVVHRNEITNKDNKRTEIRYYVKFGNTIGDYKWFKRQDLKRYVKDETEDNNRIKTRVYELANGFKLTLYAIVENTYCGDRNLRIGYALCNPQDEYDEKVGAKIAKHRANNRPFTNMYARFTGEFNSITTEAIMDVKARYIAENIDKFVTIS